MHAHRPHNQQTRAHVDNLLAQVEAEMALEQARKEAEERARQEAEERARREAEERARQEEERRRQAEEERKRKEAEERARQEAEERKRRAEAERIRQEEMERALQEVEERLRREMNEQMRQEAEARARNEEQELQKRLVQKAALQKSYLEAIKQAEERGRQEAERRLRAELELLTGTTSDINLSDVTDTDGGQEESAQTADGCADQDKAAAVGLAEPSSHDADHKAGDGDARHQPDVEQNGQEEVAPSDTVVSSQSESHQQHQIPLKSDTSTDDDLPFGAKYLPKSAAAQMAAMLERAANKPVSQTQIALSETLLFKAGDARKEERKRLVRTLGQSGRFRPLTPDDIADEVADEEMVLADMNFDLPTTKGDNAPEKIETMKRQTDSEVELREDDEVTSSVSATSSFKVRRTSMSPRMRLVALIGIACLVLVVSSVTLWSCTHKGWLLGDDQASKPAAGTAVQFEVKTDSSWRLVAMDLRAQGLIDDTSDLIDVVKSLGLEQQLKPGVFNLTVGQTPDEIAQILSHESNSLVRIPEGLTVKQTAEVVAKKSDITVDEFMAQAKASNYVNDFPFLKDAYDDSLEGYLFPKSYNLVPGSTADSIIRMMLKQYAEETKGISYEAVESRGLTQKDLVIVASLIERETARDDERARIASVIYNRLDIKMKLQLCPTVIYALGGKTDPLTYDDLKVDSPYNTYLIDALPPGPICSPSLKSLQAAAHPETTDYLFYVSKGDGTHLFTKDYGQFEEGKAEYWNMQGRS